MGSKGSPKVYSGSHLEASADQQTQALASHAERMQLWSRAQIWHLHLEEVRLGALARPVHWMTIWINDSHSYLNVACLRDQCDDSCSECWVGVHLQSAESVQSIDYRSLERTAILRIVHRV